MSNVLTLTEPDGTPVIADEGEWTQITGKFKDLQKEVLDKASIQSLTLTLYDETTGDIINNRQNQNILDANGGTVAANGDLTLNLNGSDNVIVANTGQTENHIALTRWVWTDLTGDTVEGFQQWRVRVSPLAGPITEVPDTYPVQSDGSLASPLWIGNSYLVISGDAFIWEIDSLPGFSTAAIVKFRGFSDSNALSWDVDGIVTDIGGGKWRLTVEMTAEESSQICPGSFTWATSLEEGTLVSTVKGGSVRWAKA